jgi:hypothetical protein
VRPARQKSRVTDREPRATCALHATNPRAHGPTPSSRQPFRAPAPERARPLSLRLPTRSSYPPDASPATPCTSWCACPEIGELRTLRRHRHGRFRRPLCIRPRRSARLTHTRHVKVSIPFITSSVCYKRPSRLTSQPRRSTYRFI